MHTMIRDFQNGMGSYNALVDLEGSQYLNGRTMLYLIDGLYGGKRHDAVPVKWNMPPFNTNWPASLFASQDIVAIDSVAPDFLRSEWGLMPNADNFLHEAALADNPPSGTFYAPNGDGVRLASMGVHEHWNNAISKQYSRNLTTNGTGIELVTIHPGSGINLALTRPINGAAINPGSDVTLRAAAASSYTGIRQVDYYGNGTLLGSSASSPYTVVWSNAPAGNWALTAVATDAENLSATSAVVNVTVTPNDLAVTITSPTNGAILTEGSNPTVQAVASATSSAIGNVDLYANDVFLGTGTNNPASAPLANLFPGTWTLTALATDTNALAVLSDPVTVNVRPAKIAIAGTLYVDLRATNLSADGSIWTNWGSLGNFLKYGRLALTANVSGTGVPGVRFRSTSVGMSFAGPTTVPDLEASSDRSVETWAFKDSTVGSSNRTMVAWSYCGGPDGTAFAVDYNGSLLGAGAAFHGGSNYDIGWGDSSNIPPMSAWHHFVYTFDGGTVCRIYVDGALRITKTLPAPLNTTGGTPS